MKEDYTKRVVRNDGEVQHDWKVTHRYEVGGIDRVMMERYVPEGEWRLPVIKTPSLKLYLHWQEGGLCRSTGELEEVMKS